MEEESLYEIPDDDAEALLGQAIIDRDLLAAKTKELVKMKAAELDKMLVRDLLNQIAPYESTSNHAEDAVAYATKKVKAVSGAFHTGGTFSGTSAWNDYDARWEHDLSKSEVSPAEEARQARADKILDDIGPEIEEILQTQKKAVVSAAKAYVEEKIRDVEMKLATNYGKKLKDLEDKLELLLAMQNPDFGRF